MLAAETVPHNRIHTSISQHSTQARSASAPHRPTTADMYLAAVEHLVRRPLL